LKTAAKTAELIWDFFKSHPKQSSVWRVQAYRSPAPDRRWTHGVERRITRPVLSPRRPARSHRAVDRPDTLL